MSSIVQYDMQCSLMPSINVNKYKMLVKYSVLDMGSETVYSFKSKIRESFGFRLKFRLQLVLDGPEVSKCIHCIGTKQFK
ncbi:hypothetical protein GLOIN_2v1786147 [Rhizophagus irregularis DAOM 181602=DAOM 197198]|nr:hypothetical protein GLOIN_2v1786147 [Rhizophagus irregularis DAOM 181602=DAOM 197198]